MYFLEEAVLPPGEKIRRIRNYLGLKQYEITGGKVTRNLISYIENGKTKLVEDTAKIIVDSMNEWADKKKIPLNIDVEYLMRNEITQVKILLNKYINNLKKYLNDENEKFENELNKAKDILKDWDVTDEKAEIHEITGDYHYEREQYNESYINYLKSLESYIRSSNHLKTSLLYSKLARCAIWLENYQEAISLSNYALLILENQGINDESIVKRALFNNALAYKKLGLFDEALSLLDKLKSMMHDRLTESEYIDMLLLRGNSYTGKQNYSIAEKIYRQVIDIASKNNNLEILAVTYMNLSELYLILKEEEKSIECINNCLKIRLNTNYKYLDEIYLYLGKTYMNISKYNLSEKYLLKALKESKKKNNLLLQIDTYKELLNCYMLCNQKDSIAELLEEVRKVIAKNSEISKAKDIFLKASYYYIEKDIEKSKELLKFGIDMMH